MKLEPNSRDALNALRITLVKLGRLIEAHSVWQPVLSDLNASHADVDGYAELCLHLGLESEYHQTSQMLMERFQNEADPQVCERLGRACLLKPRSHQVAIDATVFIDRALTHELPEDRQWARPYLLFAKALADYRLGQLEEAVTLLRGESGAVLQPAPQILLAMALHKSGENEEPQRLLDEAILAFHRSGDANSREQWMMASLLQECQELLAAEANRK